MDNPYPAYRAQALLNNLADDDVLREQLFCGRRPGFVIRSDELAHPKHSE